jgi:hypothetical protein
MVLQLKVVLREIEPQIWRRLKVPGSYSLAELHHVLQVAIGWENCHLHQFTVGGVEYTELDPEEALEAKDEREFKMSSLARTGRKFTYEYDFGDGWVHDIVVEAVDRESDDDHATCVAGKRAGPLEDSHGPHGHMNLCKALKNPRRRDHEEMKDWAGDYDPAAFDVDEVNRQLLDLFERVPPQRSTMS